MTTAIPGTISIRSTPTGSLLSGCYNVDSPLAISGREGLSTGVWPTGWTEPFTVYATGCALGSLEQVDTLVAEVMRSQEIPNLTLALVDGTGSLKLARGYSYPAAIASPIETATPYSRFRISSVAKVLTAIAVMQLVETGWLSLHMHPARGDIPGFDKLGDAVHPEWAEQITVKHLLTHTAGWDRDVSWTPDPTRRDSKIAESEGVPLPIDRRMIYDYVRRFRHYAAIPPYGWEDFGYLVRPPGEGWTYSNFGYLALADIVQAALGSDFWSWVEAQILRATSCADTELGHSLKLLDRELQYWSTERPDCHVIGGRQPMTRNARNAPPVGLPGNRECAEYPYGDTNHEIRWGASTVVSTVLDLVRVGIQLSESTPATILTPSTVAQMRQDQIGSINPTLSEQWGLGLMIKPYGPWTRGHSGRGKGNCAELCIYMAHGQSTVPQAQQGAVAAVLCNRQPRSTTIWNQFVFDLLDTASADSRGLVNISNWGAGDLWSRFPAAPPSWLS